MTSINTATPKARQTVMLCLAYVLVLANCKNLHYMKAQTTDIRRIMSVSRHPKQTFSRGTHVQDRQGYGTHNEVELVLVFEDLSHCICWSATNICLGLSQNHCVVHHDTMQPIVMVYDSALEDRPAHQDAASQSYARREHS